MKKGISVGLIFMILASCTTSIQSNKAQDFNDKIENLYVILKVADNTGKFPIKLETSLKEELRLKNLESRIEIVNPLALETEKDIMKRVENSGLRSLMVINQVETTVRHGNSWTIGNRSSGGKFDIKIFVYDRETPIWRASLKTDTSGYGGIGGTASTFAKKLVERLVHDRLI